MSFSAALARDAGLIQARLDAALAGKADVHVVHAMRYAVQGGKRLRGFLVLEGARMLGVAEARAIAAAAAIEALHAYSLIHDDLPCMDDDDLRRGLPTVHVTWDQATAVLAGDALQSIAFELLCDASLGSAEVRMALVSRLARASGAEGMVLGQALDIAAETAVVLVLPRTVFETLRRSPAPHALALFAAAGRQLVRDQRRANRHLGRAVSLALFNRQGAA